MSLENQISDQFKLDFDSSVKAVLQQRKSKLRPYVTEKSASGQATPAADLVGTMEAQEDQGRTRENLDMKPPLSRRWLVFPNRQRIGGYIDHEDTLRLMTDPTSSFLQSAGAGINRRVDDIIAGRASATAIGRGGMLGAARSGQRGDEVSDFPAANRTAHNNEGLTQAKLEVIREKMLEDENDLDDDDPMMGIAPRQLTNLIQLASTGTSGFNLLAQEELKAGRVVRYMGFRFLLSNRWPKIQGIRQCPVWWPSQLALGVWEEINTYVAPDPSKEGTPYWSIRCRMDSVRIEDDGFHVMEAAEV